MKINKTNIVLSLDRYFCGPYVVFCRWMKPIVTRFKPLMPDRVKEIVVAKYVGLGSILLIQKLLFSLRREFPSARITFLTFDTNLDLMKSMNNSCDDVITINTASLAGLISSSFKSASLFRNRQIDLFLDMEFFSRYSALMCFFSRPYTSVGYESLLLNSRTSLYSHPAKFIPGAHITENYLNQLRTVGVEGVEGEESIVLILQPSKTDLAQKRLKTLGLEPGEYVIFNPSSSDALGGYRKWPAKKWAELTARVLEKEGLPIIFTGLQGDRVLVDEILLIVDEISGKGKAVFNLAGIPDFGEFLSLLHFSRLTVTIDSGTAHFAIGLKKNTVILFGPESPEVYGYDLPYCRVVYQGLYCSPCYNIHHGKKVICRNENRCMTTITSEQVHKSISELIKNA